MSDIKPFASLSASLLARKGTAKPAMRPQLQPVAHPHDALARAYPPEEAFSPAEDSGQTHDWADDLGWNDMGEDRGEDRGEDMGEASATPTPAPALAQVVALPRAAAPAPTARRSALAQGRRAAFTLRLDAERHLKLRLACTVSGRSAQILLIDALDQLLTTYPELNALASKVRASR